MRASLRIALTVALVALFVRQVEWPRVADLLRGVRPAPLALGLVTFLIAQVSSAAKWRWIAVHLGCGASLARHVRLYFAGMFLSLFLPGFVGGDLFRAGGLAGVERRWLPTRGTLWSVFLERLTGLWGLAVVFAVGLAVDGRSLDPTGALIWAAAAGVATLVVVAVAAGWSARQGRLARRLQTVTAPAEDPMPWVLVLGASVVVQLLYALVHMLLAVALGMASGGAHWLWIAPIVGFVASLPVSLGGLGPREWGYLVALDFVGIGRDEAVAFAALWLMLVTAISLIGGGSLLVGRRSGLPAEFR